MTEGESPHSAAPRRKPRALRHLIVASLLLLGGFTTYEWAAPRERELTTRSAVFVIEQYRRYISPRLAGRIHCRFTPTCSAYGLGAVQRHGGLRGSWRALKRIARCNPTTKMGTVDPP